MQNAWPTNKMELRMGGTSRDIITFAPVCLVDDTEGTRAQEIGI